jgi:F0F1-type ATP synthase delta subunit
MTFAVEADRESLMQLAQWVRETVHPQAVIAVGLQPGLIAGVYLRTPNHVHDLSLRAALDGGHEILVNDLEALRGAN